MKSLVCVAGKNQIAVDVLEGVLAHRGSDVVVIPSVNDNGKDTWQPSLRRLALERQVPVVPLDWVMTQRNLCFLSVEFDRIVRPDRFESSALFNIHFSLLPKFRGCNTSIWPILSGEKEHGVTLHFIDEGVDTGPIIDQRRFPIDGLTARELYFKTMALGRDLVLEWFPRLLGDEVPAQRQSEDGASTFRRRDLDFSLREIDLNQTVSNVLQRVRAFTFHEYQLPTIKGYEIADCRPVPSAARRAAGSITMLQKDRLIAWAADGSVELRLVRPVNGCLPQ